MIYFLIILILINSSIGYAILFQKKIEETFFLAIISKILILFISGVLFDLSVGFYFIIIINVLLFAYNFYYIIKKPSFLKTHVLTFGFTLLLVCSIFFLLINNGRVMTLWDEFSHWALVVKNMFHLNNFGLGSESTVNAKHYLSGIALYQYFCTKLNGSFNEQILYFALNITTLSLILPIFKAFKKENKLLVLLSLYLLIIIPTIFYWSIYSSIYIDAILGIGFAYALYSYFTSESSENIFFTLFNLSMALLLLIFIKDFGLVLALIAFFIILFDNLFIKNKFKFNFKLIIKNNAFLFLTLLPAIVVKIVWGAQLISNHIVSNINYKEIISNSINLLVGNIDGYKVSVTKNFISSLFYTPLTNSSIVSGTFILSLFIFSFLAYMLISQIEETKQKRRITSLSIWVFIGGIGYSFLLLVSYISFFSEYEAQRLASFTRYISSYSLGMLVLVIALMIKFLVKKGVLARKLVVISFCSLFFLNFFSLLNMTIFSKSEINNAKILREKFFDFKSNVFKQLKNNERLYFVSTNDDGYDFYIARYEITPIQMNISYGWSIGNPYGAQDVWTVFVTKEQWAEDLVKNYDYVYLFDIDEEFIQLYKSLFDVKTIEISDNQLYRVQKNIAGQKVLKLIK